MWLSKLRSNFFKFHGGLNWNSQFSANGYDMNVLYFINSLTGYAGGGNYQGVGKIFKTTNGGMNWIGQASLSHEIFAIKFINNNTGWAAGGDSYGNIFKTTNSGLNWTEQNLPSSTAINSIEFINENTGWAGSSALIYTSNGGTNWVYGNTSSTVVIYSLHFANANTGWIFGTWGSILKTTNGGNVFINNNSMIFPIDYYLYQNYPNPFNPVTTIGYSVPKSGRVVIKVFDVAGREIRTVEDVFRQAGNYSVRFDGTGLASGVYFYRMEAGDVVRTRRMVLIK